MPRLDDFEIRMLDILQRDGRKPVTELAEEIGLSATPCARRFEGLRGTGVIKGFSAQLSRRALEEPLRNGRALSQPDRVKQFCAMRLAHLRVEHCIALFLDSQLQLIECTEVARGTLSHASVYPREVVKAALEHHAAALILAHNHPSGLAEPSPADLTLTRQLKQALALVDVRLLDHLIVGATEVTSLAERGQV